MATDRRNKCSYSIHFGALEVGVGAFSTSNRNTIKK